MQDIDETFCGPLCQHPSCWDAQKRCSRGFPRRCESVSDSDSDEDIPLPTQKVVNLLEDYGSDPRDRYPAKFSGRPAHDRTGTSLHMGRSATRDSFPKVRAPNATPASLQRSSLNNGAHSAPAKSKGNPMSFVEVQEVFDLDDLHSAWNDTFMPKSYYVWVPNKTKSRKPQLEPMDTMPIRKMHDFPRSVLPKDKTEEMVPRDLGLEREPSKVRKLQMRSSPRMEAPIPYPKTPRTDRRRDNYYGIYELLDLPREVLMGVLDHIQERDLLDRQKFAEALVKAIPKLEKRSKSLALANSQVLKQRKIKLLDGATKPGPFPSDTKQVFMLDGDTLQAVDKVTSANEPNFIKDPAAFETPDEKVPNLLNKQKLLPAIGEETPRTKIPSISLGLPEIPSGVKATQPFNYKKKEFDFTLGRVPTPPVVRRVDSPHSTEKGSTLHVTMPSMPSEEVASMAKDWQREEEAPNTPLHAVSPAQSTKVPFPPAATPATRQGEGGFSTPLSRERSPQKPVSREHRASPNMPPPTAERPAPELGSPEQTALLGTIHEAETERQSQSPHAQNQGPPQSRRSVRFAEVPPTPPQPPSSPTVTSRPNTPVISARMEDEAPKVAGEEEEAANAQMDGLMVINKMKGTQRQSSSQSGGGTARSAYLAAAMPNPESSSSPGLSPEPAWPEVDETKYMNTPSPPLREETNITIADTMQSTMANYDSKSEPSNITSMPKTPGMVRESSMPKAVVAHGTEDHTHLQVTREASMQSDKAKKAITDRIMESPGPPPPSPEPKDTGTSLATNEAIVNESNASMVVGGQTATLTGSDSMPPNPPDNTPRQTNPANTPIPTEATASVGGTPRPMNIDDPMMAPVSLPVDETPRVDPLNILPTTPQAEADNKDTSYESSVGTTVLGMQGQVAQGDEEEAAADSEEKTDAQPLQAQGNDNTDIDTGAQLDQFDTSEAQLKQELKEEYDKLSEENK